MKTANDKIKLVQILNRMLVGLVFLAFAVTLIGCSDKDSNSTALVNNGFNNVFGNANFNSQNSLGAVGADATGSVELVIAFSAQNTFMNHYYTGQVFAQGQLVLSQGLQCQQGYIQPGTYSISAIQPGVAQNGVIQIQFQGPLGSMYLYTTIIDPLPLPKLTSSTGIGGLDELNGSVTLCNQSLYIYGR